MFIVNKKLEIKCIYILLLLLNIVFYRSKQSEGKREVYIYLPSVSKKVSACFTSSTIEYLKKYESSVYTIGYDDKEAKEAYQRLKTIFPEHEFIISHNNPYSIKNKISSGSGGSLALSHIFWHLLESVNNKSNRGSFIASGAIGESGNIEPIGGIFWKMHLIFNEKKIMGGEDISPWVVFPYANKREVSIIANFFEKDPKNKFHYFFPANIKDVEIFLNNNDNNSCQLEKYQKQELYFHEVDFNNQQSVEMLFLNYLINNFDILDKEELIKLYFDVFVNMCLTNNFDKKEYSNLLNKFFEKIYFRNDLKMANDFFEKIFKQILNIDYDYHFLKEHKSEENKLRNLYIDFLIGLETQLLKYSKKNIELSLQHNKNIVVSMEANILKKISWLWYQAIMIIESNNTSHKFDNGFMNKEFDKKLLTSEERSQLRLLNLKATESNKYIFNMDEQFQEFCRCYQEKAEGEHIVSYFIDAKKENWHGKSLSFIKQYKNEIEKWYDETCNNLIGKIILDNIEKQGNVLALFGIVDQLCLNYFAETVLFLCYHLLIQKKENDDYIKLYKNIFINYLKYNDIRIKENKKNVYALVNFYIFYINELRKSSKYNDELLDVISKLVDSNLGQFCYLYYYTMKENTEIEEISLFNLNNNVIASRNVQLFLLFQLNSIYLANYSTKKIKENGENKIKIIKTIIKLIANIKDNDISERMVEYYSETKDQQILEALQKEVNVSFEDKLRPFYIGVSAEDNLSDLVKLKNLIDEKVKLLEK